MNDRQSYEPIEMEVIAFDAENVVVTSDPPAEGPFVPAD